MNRTSGGLAWGGLPGDGAVNKSRYPCATATATAFGMVPWSKSRWMALAASSSNDGSPTRLVEWLTSTIRCSSPFSCTNAR